MAALAVNLLMCLLLASALVGNYAGEQASAGLKERATSVANLQAAVLKTELERYRSLPYVLANDPDVIRVLATPTAGFAHRLDLKLEALSRETKVGVAYVLDAGGFGVAMSNWDSSNPFCQPRRPGDDANAGSCAGRYYFTGAIEQGRAEFFALGRADGRPGMYFSNAVESGGAKLGVVVAKVGFDAVEKIWAQDGVITFVTDEHGVVVITGIDAWRFRTVAPLLPNTRKQLLDSGQFGASKLEPLELYAAKDAEGLVLAPGRPKEKFMVAEVPLSPPGWKLHVLLPAGREVRSAKIMAGFILFLGGGLLLTITGILVRRRTRRAAEAAREIATREELERRVASRTIELTRANQRLHAEMEEKRKISKNLHMLQDELVMANKLATLGQITAGVAHEINQPVAAIRAYAENSILLLERKQDALAAKNLGLIGDLTVRISGITDELRAFSRRSTAGVAPTDVASALDGALLLTSHRISAENVKVVQKGRRSGLVAVAERMRLEQVLVNLIQNALDAMAECTERTLIVTIEENQNCVVIHVDDNGAGMSPQTFKSLFMPFVTTKANGLGLGLAISQDIVAEFGGELTAVRRERGSRFTVSLRKTT